MKLFLLLASMIVSLAANVSLAEGQMHTHNHEGLTDAVNVKSTQGASCSNLVDVDVNGLVCDFCARALEKVFSKRDEVAGIDVDLDNAKIKIAMKEGLTIDNPTLTQLITDSGYNVVNINKECS